MKKLVLIFIVSIISSNAHAGAWVKKKGEGFGLIGANIINSNQLYTKFAPEGFITLNRTVLDVTFQGYLEYGMSNKLTAIVNFPIKFVETGNQLHSTNAFNDTLPSGSLAGPSNISFGARYAIIQKKVVFSAQMRIDLNTSSYQQRTGLRTGYEAWGFSPSLLVGYSRKKLYLTAEAGITFMTNGYSDGMFAYAEIGYSVWKKWVYLIAAFTGKKSFFGGDYDDGTSLHTGLSLNNQEYFGFGLKIAINFNESFGCTYGIFGGRFVNYAPRNFAHNVGFYYKWKQKPTPTQPKPDGT